MQTTSNIALHIQNLCVNYGKEKIVDNVSFTLPVGTLAAIVGPNGAGKTTLIKALLGLIPHTQGSILFAGKPQASWPGDIAYVPQHATINWQFPLRAFDVVIMGRYPRLGWFKRPQTHDINFAHNALKLVGMQEHTYTPLQHLSGGQQQRIFLARAIAQDARWYFLDEPFSGIDAISEKTIANILKELCSKGATLCVVHHDLATLEHYFDWGIFLNKTIIASGPLKTIANQDTIFTTYRKYHESIF